MTAFTILGTPQSNNAVIPAITPTGPNNPGKNATRAATIAGQKSLMNLNMLVTLLVFSGLVNQSNNCMATLPKNILLKNSIADSSILLKGFSNFSPTFLTGPITFSRALSFFFALSCSPATLASSCASC